MQSKPGRAEDNIHVCLQRYSHSKIPISYLGQKLSTKKLAQLLLPNPCPPERNATMKQFQITLTPDSFFGKSHMVSSKKSTTIHVINTLHGDAVLLVDVDDELHLVVRAEEDSAAVVDALGDDGEHACHVAVDCLAAGCERNKSVC